MTVNLSALAGAGQQFFSDSGVPLAGGKLYSYAAGTTTPQATYTSVSGSTAHTNPIILNSAGRVATGEIWLTAGSNYKFALYTSADVLITTWDNITGINGTGIATSANLVSFTGFKGQVGTVADLADNDGADWIGFTSAGTSAVARSSQDKMRDAVSVKDFGAVGNGIVDDATAVSAWLTYIAANSKSGFVPAGTYLLGSKITISNCNKLAIYGEGSDVSIFKRADNVVTTSFTEMFSFVNQVSNLSEIVVRSVGFDGNSNGNQIPVTVSGVSGVFLIGEPLVGKDCNIGTVGATELKFTRYIDTLTAGDVITGAISGATATVVTTVSSFVWQQSHCVRISPTGTLAWNRVVFDEVWATNPTADVLGLGGNASNTYGHISVTNLFVQARDRVRSDITVTGSYKTLRVANCKTFSTEVELNGYSATLGQGTVITNLVTDTLDLAAEGTDDTTGWPPLTVTNCVVNSFAYCLGYTGFYSNVQFLLNSDLRFVRGKYQFDNCKFLARAALSTTNGLVYQAANATNARSLKFNDCVFDYEAGATLTRYYFDENAWGSDSTGAYCEPFVFNNCKFKGALVRTATLRGGKFEFSRCIHEYAGDAILYGTVGSVNDSEIKLFDNIVTDAAGYLWTPPIAYTTGPLSVWMRDNLSAVLGQIINFTRYDKIAAPQGAAVAPDDVLYFKQVDRQYESDVSPTTGKWLKSSIIWNSATAASGKVGWAVTTSGTAGSGAVFKPFGAIDA